MNIRILQRVFTRELNRLGKIAKNKANIYKPMEQHVAEAVSHLEAEYEKEAGEKLQKKETKTAADITPDETEQ